jgi:thiol-disulfide isomerase/thioredoxin
MKKLFAALVLITLVSNAVVAQTPLTTAPNFSVKTVDGTVIELYPLLDAGKIVVLDFFSVSCGPCQLYAPHFQAAFEAFGRNLGNTFFLGINFNGTNNDLVYFDSIYLLNFPSASGLDGGGNAVFNLFQLSAYPTVLVIRPDKIISNPYVWPPTTENIIDAVLLAGGTLVGLDKLKSSADFHVFPNPVRRNAVVRFMLDKAETVAFDLLDINGRFIKQLIQTNKLDAGHHTINISVENLPNGIFFVAFTTQEKRVLKKLTVLNN